MLNCVSLRACERHYTAGSHHPQQGRRNLYMYRERAVFSHTLAYTFTSQYLDREEDQVDQDAVRPLPHILLLHARHRTGAPLLHVGRLAPPSVLLCFPLRRREERPVAVASIREKKKIGGSKLYFITYPQFVGCDNVAPIRRFAFCVPVFLALYRQLG